MSTRALLWLMPALAMFVWVATLTAAQSESVPADANRASVGKTGMILAVSWQPAFCETRPNKRECASQTAARPDATQFSLHGLWMMRKTYCGIGEDIQALDKSGDWHALPHVALPPELENALALSMPGTQSALDRHEWVKHGTCSGLTAAEYYALSMRLLGELNASAVGELFADNVGNSLEEQAIRGAFEASFGPGAGDRVKMQCRRDGQRRIIIELTIGLAGEPTDALTLEGGLGPLIKEAGATKFGCPGGIVDAVGTQ
ncbi:ribonuclease [Rhizobiaceae bacterium n13]|uniref:Ribonuclease n=1 Tax=Ferirhizobium litorale TaxID=2927786 RepID=A0AAE3QIG7_9HYPH|nr:ribonuclease [Fererhizobium litorale]MDI7863760.1 ribonuclease [Fererhizobium litorale]MDI7924140.1 ribonuclease [Fererhizobium litorale]